MASLSLDRELLAMLTADMARAVSVDPSLQLKCFPSEGKSYGYVEMYYALAEYAWSVIDQLSAAFGSIDQFYDEWNNGTTFGKYSGGVFCYDMSTAILEQLRNNPNGTADVIAASAIAALRGGTTPNALSQQITSILTTT